MKKEETVKLISAEGFEFVIDKKAAMVSQTLRNMLTSPGFYFVIELNYCSKLGFIFLISSFGLRNSIDMELNCYMLFCLIW